MSSKQIQKFKVEIEALKQKIRDQEEAHEQEIQYLEKKNRDLSSINANLNTEIQGLKKKNHELVLEIQEVVDENQDLKKKNRDQKEAHDGEIQYLEKKNRDLSSINANLNTDIQSLKKKNHTLVIENQKVLDENQDLQKLCTKFENSKVFNRITLSPVSVDKLQHCTEWWCPKHSKFATIVQTFDPKNEEDKLIVDRAKARFRYWNKKDDGDTCCKNNRQNKDRNKFLPPSNWPK
ncbi:uncharacterized protein LOC100575743 [Acyrthosiphon pisum]|uniref:Uncharacterized protein n=1 Tax=Acyrthosiphon pisum TaxID=7029 RepID=A0A8R2HAW0_ACYPI|nr:uncharacterized protein LOC100575743 [Acyrthosiphon pisum]XP_016662942.1 uncharacterized protein LOC100575743 [Acyrthosiphon pisum]XP_016662943.1 uncharacterized protein LOC100575743 [Acyrthosiphon pisum]|eukprot:XP_003247016.1 PREDICTED: uncharacterized protein LOC100575743 [Acyrthosiphon pisum]